MKRILITVALLVVLVPVSVVPLGRLVGDWIRYAEFVDPSSATEPARGFDWAHWDDQDGQITAMYVFPKGPAAEAGIVSGDILYEFDFNQYFNSAELKRVIEGITPGQTRTYTVLRDTELRLVEVEFSRYPIFLYPLGEALWWATVWGFVIGAFIHLLALIIVIPLSARSRSAFLSLLLISASGIWVFGNLGRILLLTWFGPADTFGPFNTLFELLTLGSLCGWIAFPVLLVYKVVWDIRNLNPFATRIAVALVLPPILLAVSAILAFTQPALIAPITIESLIAPILFYVCCYIAAAASLSLAFGHSVDESPDEDLDWPGWSRLGSGTVVAVASLTALSVFGVVPIFGVITDEGAGWIVVAAQLLSVAPVLLISFATLKYGKVDQVLRRSLTYATVLGLFFFLFVGGLSWLLEDVERTGAPIVVIAGLYAVLLLFVFDRGWRLVGPYALEFFATDRQKQRKQIVEFTDTMRSFLSLEQLLEESCRTVHELWQPRHVCIHLRTGDQVVTISHPNHPAGLTPRTIEEIWPYFAEQKDLWARNPELNLADIPSETASKLLGAGSALVFPLVAEESLVGLLLLGRKNERGAVYTLEDVDLVRSLGTHLTLSVERLERIERERELVRMAAESQLTALRAQINPHFLFNTLNAIAALIEEKPEDAEETVEHLSAIFRETLETGGKSFVSLEREMSLVGRYLAIEQTRFGERLAVEIDIDPMLNDLQIPAFSVQTLVENAIKHGISRKRSGGVVRITARPATQSTGPSEAHHDDASPLAEVSVFDSGVGIPSIFGLGPVQGDQIDFRGIGLENVTSRLEKLYEREDLLSIESSQDEGTRALMRIPIPDGILAGVTES